MKTKLIIVIVGIAVSVLIILFVLISKGPKKMNPPEPPSPTPANSSEARGEAGVGFIFTSEAQDKEQKSFLVGHLISRLPAKDTNFAMYYSFSTNKFTVYLDPSNKELADSQFETFLKENGVEKGWIENLVIEEENITPAP